MAKEIERKFLLKDDSWRAEADGGTPFRQGYFHAPGLTGRIRVAGGRHLLTLKSPIKNLSRDEFEYEIPAADAAAMFELFCEPARVEKTRHLLRRAGKTWEIDVFAGANQGLVVAEIELESEDEPFERPAWLGREVSDDPRYCNSNLAAKPYSQWPENKGV